MQKGRGRQETGRGFSWSQTVWGLVETARPLHSTLMERRITGGFRSEDQNDLTDNLKGFLWLLVWRIHWGYKSRCRKSQVQVIQERADGGAGHGGRMGVARPATFWLFC